VSQHCVQPLRSQYQECEHKHEQDFSAETHDSPLNQALVIGNSRCCADQLLFVSFHG
jgi:hypothetical protein